MACGAGAMAWAVRGRASAVFGPSVWRGPRERRAVALTFDDGPSEGTPRDSGDSGRVTAPRLRSSRAAPTWSGCPPWRARWRKPGTRSATTATPTRCSVSARARFIEADLARAQAGYRGAHRRAARSGFARPTASRWFGMRRAQRRLGPAAASCGLQSAMIGSWGRSHRRTHGGGACRTARFCACTMAANFARSRISARPSRPCGAWFPCCWTRATNWKR